MTYISGTLTDPNPGPALHTLMATTLTAVGYTLVDTVVISTRTHKVWKCAAANNSVGLDWYLVITYTTAGAGTFAIVPFEFYDPATDLGYRGAYSGTSSVVIDATTFSRYGATGNALESGNWLTYAPNYTSYQFTTVTTPMGYWISITPERVMILQSNTADRVMCAGFYLPDANYAAKAGAAMYPLIAAFVTGSATAGGSTSAANVTAGLTRLPPATTLTGNGWGATPGVVGPNTSLITSVPPVPSGSTSAYPFVAFPIDVLANGSGFASGAPMLARLGQLRDMIVIPATASVARGDTVTIGADTYVLTSVFNNSSVGFKTV